MSQQAQCHTIVTILSLLGAQSGSKSANFCPSFFNNIFLIFLNYIMLQQKNKDKMVSIRFRDSELKQLAQQAKAVNLSRSAYITRKLQGLPVLTARVPPVNWDTYRELGAIASSLSALVYFVTC